MKQKTDHPEECHQALLALADEWERIAGIKFDAAKHEPEGIQRKFVQHGAICYFNCACQLRQFVKARYPQADLEAQVLQQDPERP